MQELLVTCSCSCLYAWQVRSSLFVGSCLFFFFTVYVINWVPSSVLAFQTPLDTMAQHVSLLINEVSWILVLSAAFLLAMARIIKATTVIIPQHISSLSSWTLHSMRTGRICGSHDSFSSGGDREWREYIAGGRERWKETQHPTDPFPIPNGYVDKDKETTGRFPATDRSKLFQRGIWRNWPRQLAEVT